MTFEIVPHNRRASARGVNFLVTNCDTGSKTVTGIVGAALSAYNLVPAPPAFAGPACSPS